MNVNGDGYYRVKYANSDGIEINELLNKDHKVSLRFVSLAQLMKISLQILLKKASLPHIHVPVYVVDVTNSN